MTKTPNLNLNVPDYQDERWDIPVNENWNLIDAAVAGKQGVATAVNYDNISNCITEIPQDIKLELNNGTLTLAQGCKGYMGNGTVRTTTGTPALKNTGAAQMFLHITSGGTGLFAGYMTGGTVSERPSSPINYATYYNTSTKKCEYYNGSTWAEVSLPIAIVTRGTDGFTSIDQVFNGFGYIGSTIFALPGVKGLIPNGRNADGSLKNIEFTTNSVLTLTGYGNFKGVGIYINAAYLQYYGRQYFVANELSDIPSNFGGIGYIISENMLYTFSNGKIQNKQTYCVAGVYDLTNSVITSLTPKTAFHAVDYNYFSELKDTVDTKANDSDVVKLTGNQTVGGIKTLDSSNGISLITKSNIIDDTVNPSSVQFSNYIDMHDKNDVRLGRIYTRKNTDGVNCLALQAWKGSTNYSIEVYSNGTTSSPTPTVSSNNNSIATTAYVVNVLKAIYPVGAVYIGTTSTCPLAAFFGTWTLKSSGRVLQGASSGHAAGTTIEAGLPNIEGVVTAGPKGYIYSGAFSESGSGEGAYPSTGRNVQASYVNFNASGSSSIYGKSATVQPPAYVVNIWERTA